ncbi:MAG TPA: endonuclease/exonuclease/phosphatase family protein [Micromonosporaceae bacterium]|nr:endonuclease/exonuclease/phosphatase family protein [Micromonosporaceae bacterium]
MTYNIKTGGHGRLDLLTRVIVKQRPDILALQELRSFERRGNGLMRRLADDIGMHPFLARSWFGQPVAVLVREPAAVTSAAPVRLPFHHAAAQVVVNTDRGRLTVIGTHLCPYSGRRRQWEARWLAARVDPAQMALLLGDLNTLDPWTDHAERLRGLPEQFRSRHVMAGAGGEVDSRAIRVLAAAGLVDLYRVARAGGKDYTAPTEHGGGQEFSRMRLDYILGTPPVAALTRRVAVVSGGETEHASDHYPVVAVLDLEVRPPR